MSNLFSGRESDEGSPSQVLIESEEGAGEIAEYFQNENTSTLRNGQESKERSWWDFMGLKRGGVVTKAIFSIVMLLFLLNVIITFVNWRSMSNSNSSSSMDKIRLEESTANFSIRLESLRTEFEDNWRNFTGKTLKVLNEQKKRLDSSENNSRVTSNVTRGKFQDLELQLEHLNGAVNELVSNYSGTASNLSLGIKLNEGKISKLGQNMDNFYRKIENQQRQSGNGSGNFPLEAGPRLEFTQEIWRDGKTGLVLAEEIYPQQHLQNRTEELRSKLEQFKIQPTRFDVQDRKVLFDLLYNSSSIRINQTDVCGGSLNFSAPAVLRYNKSDSDGNQKAQPCLWVIWAAEASTIKLHLIDLNGQLRIYNKFHLGQTNRPVQNWTRDDIFGEKVMDSNIVVVVLTPSPHTPSDVMELGLRIVNPVSTPGDVTMSKLRVTSTAQTLSSSSGQGQFTSLYSDNERRFYILSPPPGERVRISMQTVSTEQTHDFLQLFKYDNSTQDFKFIRKYTGTFLSYTLNVNYDGLEGQPMLLYFHSDGSKADEGFTAVVRSMPA